MSGKDPELRKLLLLELSRHLKTLQVSANDPDSARRAIHALKGSAGLASERELADAMQRVERRMREGDPKALDDAIRVVRAAIEGLAAGGGPVQAAWPEPPGDLAGAVLDADLRGQYASEVRDHLVAIDRALTEADRVAAATTIYRHVHTIKGAASAVGDDPMTWFCHGLEEQLKLAEPTEAAAASALEEVARYRGVLSGLLDDPDAALRSLQPANRRGSHAPSRQPSSHPLDTEPPRTTQDEATIRVAAASVDRLLDRLSAMGVVRERLVARVENAREQSRELRRLRADLAEALRLIGPPRPWGAPAAALRRIEWTATALSALGEELDVAAGDLRGSDQTLRESLADAKQHLSAMRQTPLRRLFARLSTVIEVEARRSGRAVIVRTQGAEETIDRRLAELLIEPCLQLARNAVAHGIETPDARAARGKPETGTIQLRARKAGHRLRITIEDDGAGVDVGLVRERAVSIGALAPALAEAADDNTLFALLFLPGFSTRETSDLLAGRGIGLDITLAAVQRVGGVIRLSSRRGEGFSARVEVPVESGLANVLWVVAAGEQYALPSVYVRAVRVNEGDAAERTPHLAACLESRTNERADYAIELDVAGGSASDGDADEQEYRPFAVGVDEVGRTEDVLVRPLTSLVSGAGPFAGAVLRGDGALRLAFDVHALAPRARTLGRLPDRVSERPGRPSQPPSRPP